MDFESLDSIPSMLSDRSDLAFQPGPSGHISDHMNRYKLFYPTKVQLQRRITNHMNMLLFIKPDPALPKFNPPPPLPSLLWVKTETFEV